ncbi:Gfo/Idh/MocA family protein [Pseudooceanicola algae]|uniref:dTDP-3,4-didehydro-2,6-dideoxy-alpha-D-glucose 3-reductase n=1 Tax=Pseudooceanicola algae TaxID=1537215 RepID=A0A418SF37_9RHOB|nr:Gfo/Idh/MocA family oxidoreductase [Pseudooceanicola algae]QPM89822.1 dTDP-3,4-didehydro-2,6-dideoxy-alpha-D-glucose 3-reductase [Pseudooceanicola algae]
MRPLRWGILSTAGIAQKEMLPALQAASDCKIGAIASRDLARAETVAKRFGAQAYGSYAALLDAPDIDAIYNPLPNHLHVPLTLQALAAGKHVLCEKPLALSLAEAQQVCVEAKRAGRVVVEAFMTRHHPQWHRAKALIAEGRIGRVRGVQALFSYCNTDPGNVRNQAGIGGGGLFDIGCYAIDAARFFFDAEPEAVACTMDRDPVFDTDRMTTGAARFAGGGQLGFMVATQSTLAQKLTVLGTEGYLELDAPFNCPPDHVAQLVLDSGADLLGQGREILSIPATNQYQAQAEAFVRAIASPMPQSMTDILGNAAALEAMTRAAASGLWEHIHPDQGQAGDEK